MVTFELRWLIKSPSPHEPGPEGYGATKPILQYRTKVSQYDYSSYESNHIGSVTGLIETSTVWQNVPTVIE